MWDNGIRKYIIIVIPKYCIIISHLFIYLCEREIIRPVSCATLAKNAAISRLESSTELSPPNSEYELRASRNASREQEVFSRTIWVCLAKNPIKEFVSHNIRYRNTISSITRALLASSPTVSVTGATIDILATTQASHSHTLEPLHFGTKLQ